MNKSKKNDALDCLIIGAGPAGLNAALYLARFRRNFKIFDCGGSRAACIPVSHNYPGFLNGISGLDILRRLKNQLQPYSVSIIDKKIETLKLLPQKNVFEASTDNSTILSRNILLTTGVQDFEPDLPGVEKAVHNGLIRHCPICDAYEVINQKIAVIGQGKNGLKEALFLRHYSPYITLIMQGETKEFTKKELSTLQTAGIKIIKNPILGLDMQDKCIKALKFANNESYEFDTIYSALGCIKKNYLAFNLGAKHKKGELLVDDHQQTSVKGLYAAGDIVSGLNQICVAQGQAAVAAVAIHNSIPFVFG